MQSNLLFSFLSNLLYHHYLTKVVFHLLFQACELLHIFLSYGKVRTQMRPESLFWHQEYSLLLSLNTHYIPHYSFWRKLQHRSSWDSLGMKSCFESLLPKFSHYYIWTYNLASVLPLCSSCKQLEFSRILARSEKPLLESLDKICSLSTSSSF